MTKARDGVGGVCVFLNLTPQALRSWHKLMSSTCTMWFICVGVSMYFNCFFILQYERKDTFANTYYHCEQEFKFKFSVWFFIKSVYNCGILYLVPITLMMINYGRTARTLVRSLTDSYRMQGAGRWEIYSNITFKAIMGCLWSLSRPSSQTFSQWINSGEKTYWKTIMKLTTNISEHWNMWGDI